MARVTGRRKRRHPMRRQLIALALPIITGALLVAGGRPALAGGGGGCHQPDTQAAGTTVTLTQRCFSPTVLYVQPGGTVTWKNEDVVPHVVAGSLSSWGSPVTLEVGQALTHQFATAGIFPYTCRARWSRCLAAAGVGGRGCGRRAWLCRRATPVSCRCTSMTTTLVWRQAGTGSVGCGSWSYLPRFPHDTAAGPLPDAR
jgi:plastocyanin